MNDILEELAQARPQDLDRAAPGWNLRREQLLAELDDRVSQQPEPALTSGNRHRRTLLVAAVAAAVALVVIVGAAIQTGQRVQPDPAQTVTTRTVDPNQPVHQVGAGEYFLRRTTITTDLGRGVDAYQRAVWFDDRGTMWWFSTQPDGTTKAEGPLPVDKASNPLSFMNSLPTDPAAAEKILAATGPRVVDAVQAAKEANLSPAQYRTLQRVLLLQPGAKRLDEGADTLSRPAVIVQAPGVSGSTLRFYFDPTTFEIHEVRTLIGSPGSLREVGRAIMDSEVRTTEPAPPFEPVVAAATPPATERMNRPVSQGQYLRRSVTITRADGSTINGSQWVDVDQQRWLGAPGAVAGPDVLPTPPGMTPALYLAAMPSQVGEMDRWLVQGLDPSCGACVASRPDALMMANLDANQRELVVTAVNRLDEATSELTTDSLGRPARVLTVPVDVEGRTVTHVYTYDASSGDLLQWGISDPDGKPSDLTQLVYLGSEVTDQAPR